MEITDDVVKEEFKSKKKNVYIILILLEDIYLR